MSPFSSSPFRRLLFLTLLAASLRGIHAAPQVIEGNRRRDSSSMMTTSASASAPSSNPTSPILGPGSSDGPVVNCTLTLADISAVNLSYPTCDAVVEKFTASGRLSSGYDLNPFFAANPEILPGCSNLTPDYKYCATATNTGPSGPSFAAAVLGLIPGSPNITANPNCSEYVQVSQNDTCTSLGVYYKFNEKQFHFLNNQTSCDALITGEFVCVRPINLLVYTADLSAFVAQFNEDHDHDLSDNGVSEVPRPTSSVSSAAATSTAVIPG
ncbi:hypothetical protein B0H11DRAFT_2182816 [Mycena galericulata]|nr:hypothetical protein B0H11DRAFT_2182816 [Mycena galericulata]